MAMSKKCRAQHSGPHRRHGDRNVQTRYSGKCRGQEITKNVQEESRMKDEKKKEGSKKDFVPVIIPEIKVKIHELQIHMDERMDTVNFNGDCEVSIAGGEEEAYGEEDR